ncbi:MAG: signal peptidase II [Dermatophilaceae bacterium]
MQDERGAPLTGRQDPKGSTGASAQADAGPLERNPRLAWAALLIAVGTVLVDQGTKVWALRALTPGESIGIVGDLLRLTLIRNAGAAFSIVNQATWLLTLVSVVILVVILRSIRRLGHWGWTLALGLLLGGAVGNLIDRILREPGVGRGHVIDFIDYGGLFVGNVADIAIVVAAGSIAVLAWRGIGLDGSRETDRPHPRDGEEDGSPRAAVRTDDE